MIDSGKVFKAITDAWRFAHIQFRHLIQRMDGRKIDDSFIAESFTDPTPRRRRAGGYIKRRRSTRFRSRPKPSCPLPSRQALNVGHDLTCGSHYLKQIHRPDGFEYHIRIDNRMTCGKREAEGSSRSFHTASVTGGSFITC